MSDLSLSKEIQSAQWKEQIAKYIKNEFSVSKMLCTTGVADFSSTLLSCQPRVTVMSCFVYNVIKDLESIDHLCINPIHRIGLIHK